MKAFSGKPLVMLSIILILSSISTPIHATLFRQESLPAFGYCDALLPPDLPGYSGQTLRSEQSFSPDYYETSEYLIGSVAVGIVFLESNGTVDPSSEDWTSAEESQVTNKIQTALNWWSSQNPSAFVSFVQTVNYRVPTSYEPIIRGHSDEGLWISEAMNYLGHPGDSYFTQVRDYINELRNNAGTDWAFAMFIVDSSNDPDGSFADITPQGWNWFAYAYLGGPFLVMTYDNDGWGIENMDRATAHEIGHIFYATDEYDDVTEYSGYLNVADVEGSGALMDSVDLWLSTGTVGQIGWRDSDGDGILDIVDTFPNTVLDPYSPDPTNKPTLNYSGIVIEIPFPNQNPYGTGRDVTIVTITEVEFRVDDGTWRSASSVDGAFNEDEENFSFTTTSLSVGTHNIETRGINSVDNVESSHASDEVTRAWALVYVPQDYSTIQAAINAAYSGDTILVEAGVYTENVVLNKTVSLIGADRNTTIIDGNGNGTVVNVTSNHVKISSFTIRNSSSDAYGIRFGSTWNQSVSNNIITNNGVGVNSVWFTNISNNIITDNRVGVSAEFMGYPNIESVRITNNTILSNSLYGVYIYGAGQEIPGKEITLEDNLICSSDQGIHIETDNELSAAAYLRNNKICHNNHGIWIKALDVTAGFLVTIIENEISLNNQSGIYYDSIYDASIYHNDFLDNTRQVSFEVREPGIHWSWDDGYPSGGNYWSDYDGTDLFGGSFQNETGSDDIGDTPYIVFYKKSSDIDVRDRYPLFKPYSVLHNIGITSISTSKTVVGQGYDVNVTINISNYGVNAETFNVAAYANTTIIQNFTNIILTDGNSTTLTFKWNTTEFTYGNYTISAVADAVPGEIYTIDNTYIDGWVTVTIPGDIDGDFDVDRYDFGYFAPVYGRSKGDPAYDPNSDLNCDGYIDRNDFGILAITYGQTV